jgi:hypothetical protein
MPFGIVTLLANKGSPMTSADTGLTDNHLLQLVQEQLLASGIEDVADVVLVDRHLMMWNRRLAVTAEVCDITEGKVHAHIVSLLPNRAAPDGKDKLDACVLGFGATVFDAAKQAAEVWLRLAAAPVLSCLAARPLLDADHFEGSEPWGVPGGHGFVGPFLIRGGNNAIDPEVLARSDAFRFHAYPCDGRPHLAKATLVGQDGRWTRHLEIDGHAHRQRDDDWALGPMAPDLPVVCTRFAVFFIPEPG